MLLLLLLEVSGERNAASDIVRVSGDRNDWNRDGDGKGIRGIELKFLANSSVCRSARVVRDVHERKLIAEKYRVKSARFKVEKINNIMIFQALGRGLSIQHSSFLQVYIAILRSYRYPRISTPPTSRLFVQSSSPS